MKRERSVEHTDRLGHPVEVGSSVVFAYANHLRFGRIDKTMSKMVKVAFVPERAYIKNRNVYSKDLLVVDPAEMALAILQEAQPR